MFAPDSADWDWKRFVKRFKARVRVDQATGCHLWTGTKTSHGYGCAQMDGRSVGAHRIAYYIAHGAMPADCVLHRCDVRLCCNPDHLWPGTRADNNQDRAKKGRGNHPHGEAHAYAKVPDATVRAIFTSTDSKRVLAARYGVTHGYVWLVKHRRCRRKTTADL